jgi:osmotically-inducible protein OsmY
MFHHRVGPKRARLWLSLGAVLVASSTFAQTTPPDNTKINTRDRAASAQTADQQKNNRSDVTITRDIRRAIAADKNLSAYAHNIKVITQHGEVTLKGPVPPKTRRK